MPLTPAVPAEDIAQHVPDMGRLFHSLSGDRRLHVQAVGALAQDIYAQGRIPASVMCAAWLHDIGYAPALHDTGCHAIDGARFLSALDFPQDVVGLVAWHTGAWFEADERGLGDALAAFPRPAQELVDWLTFIDLSVGPAGQAMAVEARVAEILQRYEQWHPVARAVERSRGELLASAARAAAAA